MSQQERTALVTGGNRGIGFAIANGLAAKGCHVLLACRDAGLGKEAANQIAGRVTNVELDLSVRETTAAQMQRIQAEYEPIDILVNNAGILEEGSLLDVRPEAFAASMRVNFEAPYEITKQLLPGMVQRGFGRVVNVSSGWGSFTDGLTGPAAYSISKAALNALTLSAAQAVPAMIVKVNAMCPGWVRTGMCGPSASRSPEEGADTAIWLATLPSEGPSGGFFRDRRRIEW